MAIGRADADASEHDQRARAGSCDAATGAARSPRLRPRARRAPRVERRRPEPVNHVLCLRRRGGRPDPGQANHGGEEDVARPVRAEGDARDAAEQRACRNAIATITAIRPGAFLRTRASTPSAPKVTAEERDRRRRKREAARVADDRDQVARRPRPLEDRLRGFRAVLLEQQERRRSARARASRRRRTQRRARSPSRNTSPAPARGG